MKQKIVLIVAVVAGLLAALLTRTYLSTKDAEFRKLKQDFTARHGTLDALIFAKDVPSGTVIQKADLYKCTVPAAGLRGQALTTENIPDIVGRKLVNGRRAKEILFWSDIEGGNPFGGGLAGDIRKKMRAVSINASGAAAVSGMVKPNDHVDVIGTFSFPKTAPDGKTVLQELVTCTMLQNVLVLATGKETAKSAPTLSFGGTSYSTVTLEVTPREAEMLVFAEQIKGRLSLSLRNRNDTSYEKELPQVDFAKIREEIEQLNNKRQLEIGGR
ncbi:MAG: Flp pilus assembly protein CpaB [Kiritimatiellia bacterium]